MDTLYNLNGQTVATRTPTGVYYLHGDHVGSVSLVSSAGTPGSLVSAQDFDPWGQVRGTGTITQTSLNYTGQRKDTTGLLYYHARYYDPVLARFTSADTLVPGTAMGAGGAMGTLGPDAELALRPLTVNFSVRDFVSVLSSEDRFTQQKGFDFELSKRDQQKAKYPWGPADPQALNRYSYVLNNPLRYTDLSGCFYCLNHGEALAAAQYYAHLADVLEGKASAQDTASDAASQLREAGAGAQEQAEAAGDPRAKALAFGVVVLAAIGEVAFNVASAHSHERAESYRALSNELKYLADENRGEVCFAYEPRGGLLNSKDRWVLWIKGYGLHPNYVPGSYWLRGEIPSGAEPQPMIGPPGGGP